MLAHATSQPHRRLFGEGSFGPVLRLPGSSSLASATVVPRPSANGNRNARFPMSGLSQYLGVQPGTTRGPQKRSVALARVAAQWENGLNPAALRVWRGLLAHSPRYRVLGNYADIRRLFALGSLASSSWNTYSNAFRKFLEFLATEEIPVETVSESTLEMFVCYLAQLDSDPPTGNSVATYLSGIRACLRELGVTLDDSSGTRGALQGYKRFSRAIHAPPMQHAAWPIDFTVIVLRRARPLLLAFRLGPLPHNDHLTLVGAAHVVMATLTFSRGHTTVDLQLEDLALSRTGFHVALRIQKRPQDRLPFQQHFVQDLPDDPVQFLLDFMYALIAKGMQPSCFLFRTDRNRSLKLDMAVKHLVELCSLQHPQFLPLTGHTVRVGAVSAAFAIGVPVATCAYMCAHKHLVSTYGYIRHDLQPTAAAFQYFGHLRPKDRPL